MISENNINLNEKETFSYKVIKEEFEKLFTIKGLSMR